jgi:hypothetical protein
VKKPWAWRRRIELLPHIAIIMSLSSSKHNKLL